MSSRSIMRHASRFFSFLAAVGFALHAPIISLAAPPVLVSGDVRVEALTGEGAKKTEVHLKITAAKMTRSSVFVVENPPRIVVDLFGSVSNKNKETSVNDKVVQKIRIGAHPDKTRIVIDMAGTTVPPYSWSESKQGALLKVNFTPDDDLQNLEDAAKSDVEKLLEEESPPVEATQEAPAVKAEAVVEPVEEEPLADIVPRVPAPTATNEPTPLPTKAATPTTQPTAVPPSPTATAAVSGTSPVQESSAAARDEIAALEFGYSGDPKPSPIIKLKLGAKTEFELKKVDEKTYKLQIPKTRVVSPPLKLPQFPPHDFVGFSVVLLKQYEGGVEATIGVERGVRISAAPNQNEIWIKTIGGSKTLTQSPPSQKSAKQ